LSLDQSRSPRRPSPLSAFLLGLITGLIYFTGTLYWITHVMATYGDMPTWVAVLINAALIVYLSLFPAFFAAAMRRLVAARGHAMLFAAPIVWTATELGREHLLTGFPWVLLGYSQTTVLPIAQLASITGVYGVSMLVCAVSAAVVFTARSVRLQADHRGSVRLQADHRGSVRLQADHRGPAKAGHYIPLGVTLVIVFMIAAWGSRRIAANELTRAGDPIHVGLVQGNVDQAIKWDPSSAAAIFDDHIRYTRQAIMQGASLVLWPESSTPFMFEEDRAGADRLRTIARQAHVTLLFGSDQIERGSAEKYYNSAFVIRSDGTTAGVYRKMHLVPFGEYVPLQQMLFFAGPLTKQVGTFAAGATPEVLPIDGHKASIAICYEVVYPSLVRQFVAAGSELLTTITNDAWFGRTSAPYQHFEQASMRAIEEGRYLVRAANTGISGIVDPYGRVIERSDIYQPAVLAGEARFLRASTVYAQYGDVAAYASLAATIALLLMKWRVQ
jgi:apolipoprotein N-acyltransferase